MFLTNLGQPYFATPHAWPHTSASVQKESTFSGCFTYASRSERSKAVRTASITPWRAAAEMFTPSFRARSARSLFMVNVVLEDAIPICYQIVIVIRTVIARLSVRV